MKSNFHRNSFFWNPTFPYYWSLLGHPVIARATGCHVLLSPLSVRICEIVWVIKSEKFLGWCLSSFTGFCHEFYDKMECCLACNYEFAGLGCSFYFMLVFWCLIWIIVIHCKSVNCFYSFKAFEQFGTDYCKKKDLKKGDQKC